MDKQQPDSRRCRRCVQRSVKPAWKGNLRGGLEGQQSGVKTRVADWRHCFVSQQGHWQMVVYLLSIFLLSPIFYLLNAPPKSDCDALSRWEKSTNGRARCWARSILSDEPASEH